MSDRSAADVARAFLEVVWAEIAPDDAQLAAALDRLLAASHDVPPADGADGDVGPPGDDWSGLYKEVGARFPDYGYYTIASPLDVGEAAVMTGDAIDDLADLTSDLRNVVWRGEHLGADDAAWYFRLMYEVHWGRHARELALFLHARLMASGD
jgi:hypothetical protein